jgi:hypothetical protein
LSAEKQKRKLAAILSANAVEYGRLMGEDEAGTLQTLKVHRQVMCSLIEKHQGRVVDTRGDNLLAEFASVVDALECAVEIQKELRGRNETGDPKREYFTDGFTEQIITSLSKIPALFVISRNSTFTYKGKPVKVQQVGEELGVRYVLEGSVQKFSRRIRINVQLIDAISGQHVWAESYDRDLKDNQFIRSTHRRPFSLPRSEDHLIDEKAHQLLNGLTTMLFLSA